MPFVADEVQSPAAPPAAAPAARRPRFVPDAVQSDDPLAAASQGPPAPAALPAQVPPPAAIPNPPEPPGFFGGLRDRASEFLGDQLDAFRDRNNRAEVATSEYIGDYVDENRAAAAKLGPAGLLQPAVDMFGGGLARDPIGAGKRLYGAGEAGVSLLSDLGSIIAANVKGPTTDPGLDPSAEYLQQRERTRFTPRTDEGQAAQQSLGALFKPVGDLFGLAGEGVGNLADAFGADPQTSQYLRTITPDVASVGLRAPERPIQYRLPEPLPQASIEAPAPAPRPVEASVVREGLEGPPGSVPPPAPEPYTGPRATSDVEVARAAGYKLKPAEAGGGRIARSTEGLSGSTRLETRLTVGNQAITNRLAAEDMGLEVAPRRFDKGVFEQAAAPQIAIYNTLGARIGLREVTPELRAELQQVVPERGATREVRAAIADDVAGADFVQLDGKEAVQKIRKLRADSNKLGRSPDPDQNTRGMAKRAIADALESELERQAVALGEPALVEQFRAARTALAKIHTYESALVGPDVSAIKLAKMLDRGAPLTGRAAIIARTGRAFPNVTRPTAALKNRTGFGVVDLLTAGGGLGFGTVAGSPMLGAAVAAARPIARSVLASDTYQNRLAPEFEGELGPNSPLGDYFQPPAARRTRRGSAPPRSTLRTEAPPPAPAPVVPPTVTPPPAAPASAAAPSAPAPVPRAADAPLGDVLPPAPAPAREPPRPVTEPADMSPRGNAGPQPPYNPPAETPSSGSLADELLDYGRIIDSEMLVEKTKRKGGVSYQPTTGGEPSPGDDAYMVSPYKDRERVFAPDAFTPQSILDFVEANADLLARDDHYVGTWLDRETGKVFLDVSIRADSAEKAIAIGRRTRQIAYFSFKDMSSHDIAPDMRELVNGSRETETAAGPSGDDQRLGSAQARERAEDLRGDQGPVSDAGRASPSDAAPSKEAPKGLGDELSAAPKPRKQRPAAAKHGLGDELAAADTVPLRSLDDVPFVLPIAGETGEKAASLKRARAEVAAGKLTRPVEVTIGPRGPVVTDGRHLLTAAREAGITDVPLRVLTAKGKTLTGAAALKELQRAAKPK